MIIIVLRQRASLHPILDFKNDMILAEEQCRYTVTNDKIDAANYAVLASELVASGSCAQYRFQFNLASHAWQ